MQRILFGDNQFFGINHFSEEKARQQTLRFQDKKAILDVVRAALDAGVDVLMCTTHERMEEIADVVRASPAEWKGLQFYPCMPYAHKYANAITEHGYFDAVKRLIPNGGFIDAAFRGGKAVLTRDVESVATLLIDAEMKAFRGLETPIVFVQNVVTDLLLGLGYHEAFKIFADHIKGKFGAEAGFITMNLPMLLPALASVGIKNPIVCANVNKVGFRMSGGLEAYREATSQWPSRIIAMSVLASGAIPAREAIEWIVNEKYVESILFGASSKANIESTVALIREYDAAAEAEAKAPVEAYS